eukprot:CAMPEP_0206592572 /NCGR_PEP_ID=MMETSP0325_2-20121206/41046_1 /ASSEMBLY_ACC=CAM_ASM_000347 /TAXON_ID=2866 /ORGANISM="Crypthecodinium cohnii, Strain Seligo" /LENGTH=53 /DNA_ID=CAMNT_0054102243 /DNA_START=575 /DNA_END=736 /DNA_ORIENTATION=-
MSGFAWDEPNAERPFCVAFLPEAAGDAPLKGFALGLVLVARPTLVAGAARDWQ